MKFRGHETFFIRKGWLGKGMKNVNSRPDVFVSKEKKPMDVLGIGSNMVKSLRYWMQAVGLTVEPKSGKRVQTFTDMGKVIYHEDPYLEEQGTLALLQWYLAHNKENATAWYYFFYIFKMQEFTKEDFVQGLKNYVLMKDESAVAAERSYQEDFNCIISTYLPRSKTTNRYTSPENNISCPLGELGLIDIANRERKSYRKTMLTVAMLPALIAMAIIIMAHPNEKEIEISNLLNGHGSIGRAFNMDMTLLLEILRKIEDLGEIKIIRTAGLDVIKITKDKTSLEYIEQYYQEIKAE